MGIDQQHLVKVALVVGIVTLMIFGINAGIVTVQSVSNSSSSVTTNTGTNIHTLSTDGSGSVTLSPDEVQITIGELTQAASAQAASESNAKVISAVLTQLWALGVTNNSISTVSYTVGPVYDYKSSPPSITSYQVQNTLQITIQASTVKDLGTKASQVIDAATGAGANQVSQVAFTLSSQTMKQASNQALQLAVQDAGSKAQLMASSLDVKIAGVVSISSVTSTPPVRMYTTADSSGAAKTTILPGDFTVTASVQVVYEIQ